MKIHEIEYFFWVCKYSSFSKAAQNLFISRQSLLRSVNNLENELGHPLFSRGPMGVTLTEFGKIFYEKAQDIIKNIDELKNVANDFSKKQNAHIGIGIRGNFRSAYIVKSIIHNFQEAHKKYDIEIIGCETPDIIPSVQEGRLDFGFTIIPDSDEYRDLKMYPLERLDYCLLTNTENRLSKEKEIIPSMLGDEKIMLAAFSHHPGLLVDKYASLAGVNLDVYMDTIDMGFMYQMAHQGKASGILLKRDGLLASRVYDNLVCLNFNPEIYIELGLIYKESSMSEHKKAFIKYLKANYSRIRNNDNLF